MKERQTDIAFYNNTGNVIDVIELFGFCCIFWCYKHLISS